VDGTEPFEMLVDENLRLYAQQVQLVDLLADLAHRRYLWQELTTRIIREKAALQVSLDRLRVEMRRYTRAQLE
jgi:hypothetical protein